MKKGSDFRRVLAFPFQIAGALIWVVAAALLLAGDAISGRHDGDLLLRLR